MDEAVAVEVGELGRGGLMMRQRTSQPRGEEARFPPPLSWLVEGKQSKFFKGERRDGRLVMTEVSIERPKIFGDGRLRLDFIGTEEDEAEEEKIEGREWVFRRCQEVVVKPPFTHLQPARMSSTERSIWQSPRRLRFQLCNLKAGHRGHARGRYLRRSQKTEHHQV